MGHALLRTRTLLERGDFSFWYRPRVEQFSPDGLEDVQRLLIVLEPPGGPYRVLAIGRKRIAPGLRRERFWGFVDLVLHDPRDLAAALAAQTYNTRTRGLRHVPAARRIASGRYSIERHGEHAHLVWSLSSFDEDEVGRELSLASEASVILTVANPDPKAWGLFEPPNLQGELFDIPEVHVTVPTTFPPELQERFEDRRYAPLDSIAWLDHPGAELIFISSD